MKRYASYQFDNRDAAQMYDYMEARIEALRRRILQLEEENDTLRWRLFVDVEPEAIAVAPASA